MLDVENKLILQVAPAKMYDSLPVMHKLEVSVLCVVDWCTVVFCGSNFCFSRDSLRIGKIHANIRCQGNFFLIFTLVIHYRINKKNLQQQQATLFVIRRVAHYM